MKLLISIILILFMGVVAPSSSTLVLASSADDIGKAVVSLIKLLKNAGVVLKEHEIIRQMGKNIDEFIPYLRQLPKDERIRLYLTVAEEKKIINASDKIRINREIIQGKYSEEQLVESIKNAQKIRNPINSRYAGGSFTADDLAKRSPELAKKYPDGVKFTKDGYPDFEPYAKTKVSSDKLTGDRINDAKLANKQAGYDRTPEGYVWHHHQDCKTILLVPLDLHDAVRHSGGAEKLLKGGEKCLF